MIALSSWGRLNRTPHRQKILRREHLAPDLAGDGPGIARGMARSYGDACLNPGGVAWSTLALDRLIGFDPVAGLISCEAGVTLRDIQRVTVRHGWMLPVTPGTQLITVGGAIANDVHGKNHHRQGSFGDHVLRLVLLRSDGERITCGPDEHPGWFEATVGGIGLTGLIVEAEIRLQRTPGPWLSVETKVFPDFNQFLAIADASDADWEHTVAWIDCRDAAGPRGVFERAKPVDVGPVEPFEKKPKLAPNTPLSFVNQLSLPVLNAGYYTWKSHQPPRSVKHYEAFLYPLDSIAHWNRLYGPHGFFQYQCVIPRATAKDAIAAMLQESRRGGQGSFLSVLKTFGDREPVGMLSFPMPGVTLALDFPNRGASTLALFDRFDAIIREARGRLYLAKDARMPRELFEAGYPRLAEFLAYRDPGMRSAMSHRLMGA